MSHHHSVVELVERSFPLGRPVVVEQLDQTPVSLVKPKKKSLKSHNQDNHPEVRPDLVVVVSSVVRAHEASLYESGGRGNGNSGLGRQ